MKPIYRIIAAFLIGPVLYMSMAFTVFKTECLHTGKVGWDVYEPIGCFGSMAETEEKKEPSKDSHHCCHKDEKAEESSCHASTNENSTFFKGKCCTNEMISGYVEVLSLMQDTEDIQPVSFTLFWTNTLPEVRSLNHAVATTELLSRPPPLSVGEHLSTLQVYRL